LNIALVILHADPAKGGAERYTFDLSVALARQGHAATLLASTFGPRPDGVTCVELGEHGFTRLARYERFLSDLDEHLRRTTYDVVHAMLPVRRCDVYHPHAGVAAAAIESGHRKHAGPVRRALADMANRLNPKRLAFARVERDLLTGTMPPVVLCLSEYVKETVRRHYPLLPDDRLATLFNAVDLLKYDPAARQEAGQEVRARFRIDAGRTVALMIAQDFGRKGLAETLAALRQVDDCPVLLVVGKEDPRRYARLVADMVADRDVIFAGPTTDPYAFYAAADFFVLPTRHDPCSLVVLEALAMGVPVISTHQNGACEIMTDGVHGFVLPSADDREGLVRAMRAMNDTGARARMRAACLALRPALAYETHLQTLLNVYGRVAEAREGGRRTKTGAG
jgi:UDP-glucose:(heptosyl)LPS alpha-1,3-glucosyltransferase